MAGGFCPWLRQTSGVRPRLVRLLCLCGFQAVPIGTAGDDVIRAGYGVDEDEPTGPVGEKPDRADPVALLGCIDAAAKLSCLAAGQPIALLERRRDRARNAPLFVPASLHGSMRPRHQLPPSPVMSVKIGRRSGAS